MFYSMEFQVRGSGHAGFRLKMHQSLMMILMKRLLHSPISIQHANCLVTRLILNCTILWRKFNLIAEITQSCARKDISKPPVKSTFITRPPEYKPDGPNPKVWARAKRKSVWDLLHDPAASFRSTEDIFAKCNMIYEEFSCYLESMTDGSAVMVHRDPEDCWVNPQLLKAWNAKMDLQYILNPYSCIMYMLSYLTKAEHKMSEYLKCIVQKLQKRWISSLPLSQECAYQE